MRKHQVKKYLGQHFLIDKDALDGIISVASLNVGDCVLEIGPGEGVLTKKLLEKASKVIAIEKDKELVRHLDNKFKKDIQQEKLIVLGVDILDVDLPELLYENNIEEYKVVANIPYYITGKILRLLMESEETPSLIILLVQKEVGERICAKKGRANLLSTIMQIFGEAKILFEVNKKSFHPSPKVDSVVIKIVPHEPEEKMSPEKKRSLIKLIKIGFASPRKTLLNNLFPGMQKTKKETEHILQKCGFNKKTRAQELNLESWQYLLEVIAEMA